jgi:hypothetical protein
VIVHELPGTGTLTVRLPPRRHGPRKSRSAAHDSWSTSSRYPAAVPQPTVPVPVPAHPSPSAEGCTPWANTDSSVSKESMGGGRLGRGRERAYLRGLSADSGHSSARAWGGGHSVFRGDVGRVEIRARSRLPSYLIYDSSFPHISLSHLETVT